MEEVLQNHEQILEQFHMLRPLVERILYENTD